MRLASRLALPALLVLAGVSCGGDSSTGPSGPPPGVQLTPTFDADARRALEAIDAFQLGVESARVVLQRGGETVLDTTFVRTTAQAGLPLALTLARQLASVELDVQLELRHGTTTMFSGTGSANSAEAGGGAGIALQYTGPGADVRVVRIAERDVRLTTGGTMVFTATAQTTSGQPATLGQAIWFTTADTIGTVTPGGAFTAATRRGTARVGVMTPSGARDTVGVGVTPPPAQLVSVAGAQQEAPAGRALPLPVTVQVLATDGLPLEGVVIAFTGPADATITPALDTTDAEGRASTTLTLGRALGTQTFGATVQGSGVPTLALTATATVGFNTTLAADSGDAQQGVAGEAAATRLVARATDETGAPLAGATVSFAVTAGNGTLAATTATTDAAGRAAVAYTHATTAGAQQVTATLPTASGPATATFALTATAGPVARIVAIDSARQDTVAATLAQPLAVRAVDRFDNAVAGARVQWRVAAGEATVDTTVVTTAADGTAARALTLGQRTGIVTVRAAVAPTDTLVGEAAFTVTVTPGAPRVASSGGGGSAAPGTAVATAPYVLLRDQFDNPVPGASVTFAVVEGGGSVTGATATSGADGIARVGTWTLGTTGTQRLRATVGGTGETKDFTATVIAGAAHEVRLIADATVTQLPYGISFTAKVFDRHGNPVTQNAPVTVHVVQGGGKVQTYYTYGPTQTDTLVNTQANGSGHPLFWNVTTTGPQRLRAWLTGAAGDTATLEAHVVSAPAVALADTAATFATWVPATGDSVILTPRFRFTDAGVGIAGAGVSVLTNGSCQALPANGGSYGSQVSAMSGDSGYFRVRLRYHRLTPDTAVTRLGGSCLVTVRNGSSSNPAGEVRAFFAPRGAQRYWFGRVGQTINDPALAWGDPAHWREVATGAPGVPAANELLWVPAHAYGMPQLAGSTTLDSLVAEGPLTGGTYGASVSAPPGAVINVRRLLAGYVGGTVVVGAPDAPATLYAGSGYTSLVVGDATCAPGTIEVRRWFADGTMFNRDSTVFRCPTRMLGVSVTAGDAGRTYPVLKTTGSGSLEYLGGQLYIRGHGVFAGGPSVVNGVVLLDGNLTIGPNALQAGSATLTAQGGRAQTLSITGDGNVLPRLAVAPISYPDLTHTTLTLTSNVARTFATGGVELQSRTGQSYYTGAWTTAVGRLVLGSGVTLDVTDYFSMGASSGLTVNAGAALRLTSTLAQPMSMASGATISGGGAFSAAPGKGCAAYTAQITTASKSCPQ